MKNSLFLLKDKAALLTGGGRGIGLAIALGLRDYGAKVAVFERNWPSPLPDKIKFYKVDIRNKSDLKKKFNQFIKDFKRIDILINNAGITFASPCREYPIKKWVETLDTNLSAAFLLCQLAGKNMIQQKQGGSIINLTSIGASQGFPHNPAYAASKGGLRQLTKALAAEWGRYGIRVNNLAPGYTHTPMNKKSWNNSSLNKIRRDHTMLGRWAEPEDMIGPVIFLASDASRYVTGTDLLVDGGWVSKGI